MSDSPVCVITGVGPGNGWALTRRFAQAGYRVAMLARDQERLASYAAQCAQAQAFPCDVSDPETLQQTLAATEDKLAAMQRELDERRTGAESLRAHSDRMALEYNDMKTRNELLEDKVSCASARVV